MILLGDTNLNTNNKVLMFVLLGAVLFFIFVMPTLDKNNNKELAKLKEGLENISSNTKLDQNLCSRQCCKHVQWPVPGELTAGNMTPEQLANFIPSNLTCSNGDSSGGCLCIKKEEFNFLANRGTNAGVNTCGLN